MSRQYLSTGILVGSFLSLFAQPLIAQNRIIQQSSSRATASGNSVAASQVEQYATQNGSANPQQQLTIEQYGSSNAVADGENNVVITEIYQESHQQGSYGTGNRQSVQRATQNSRAKGHSNKIFSHVRQYNSQN